MWGTCIVSIKQSVKKGKERRACPGPSSAHVLWPQRGCHCQLTHRHFSRPNGEGRDSVISFLMGENEASCVPLTKSSLCPKPLLGPDKECVLQEVAQVQEHLGWDVGRPG